ncbi:MAG: cysteine desulfurase-like protein [Bacteroidia bacterium]|nr:cysteine desulfurase-like protein [Bacteroidia bacterium]
MTNDQQLNLPFVRSHFPALKNDFIFMDNAGGSQVLESVIDRTSEFFRNHYVQLGASYEVSARAGTLLDDTIAELATFVNARNPKEIVVGTSTSMLLRILSICISRQWEPGDEVIVTNSDHEANVSCWTDLEEKGIIIKIWKINHETLRFELNDLRNLLTDRTRLVAMVHISNILGTINPIKEVATLVHQAGVLLCVDGVAAAPHTLIDVGESDADFYAFSTYKVFGPHLAVLYGKLDLLLEMDGINHYFFTKKDVPYKFQPGHINFELTYSPGAIPVYFSRLHDHHFPEDTSNDFRNKYRRSYDLIAGHEEQLANKLIQYLETKSVIRIIGERNGSKEVRVPTISFVHDQLKSSEVVTQVDPYRIGIRYGDFYAKKIIQDLGLEEKDGVIRVSLVHYNTLEEVERLIEVLEGIL